MKKLTNLFIAALYSLSTLAGLAVFAPATVKAASTPQTIKVAPVQAGSVNQSSTAVNYYFVAQSGDSFSKIARKSVQIYGIKNKVNLSRAKIIAAETWLTQQAGSPNLNKGEKVKIKEADVKKVVDKASKISNSSENAWAQYTVGVNFNTDNVGE